MDQKQIEEIVRSVMASMGQAAPAPSEAKCATTNCAAPVTSESCALDLGSAEAKAWIGVENPHRADVLTELLCNAETMEAGHAAHHGIIGCKQKIMSIIVVSHAALLSVLAVHQLVDVIKILFHNLSEFKSKESEKRSATLSPEIPSLTSPG